MAIDSAPPPARPAVITWPAPAGEVASPDFAEVSADGVRLFVYQAPVRVEILPTGGLASHKPDYAAERASFVIFDMSAPVTVRVVPGRPFKTATLRPERVGIATRVSGGAVEFTLDRPRKMTLLLDNDTRTALHLFAGEPEKDVPAPEDPNVLYFGPGVHETTGIALKSGQTLYLAGGAVLKAKLKPGDTGTYSEQWKVVFHHGSLLGLNGVKDVRIRDCFVRNHDDSIVVKTPAPDAPAEEIEVEGCTVWSDWGYALGVTYETRSPVRNVSFRGNDIIYSRHWALGIHLSDGALVENPTVVPRGRGPTSG